MRRIFFWLHLTAGVTAGSIILIMSITGVLLTYEKQMIAWFDTHDLPALAGGTPMPLDALVRLGATGVAGPVAITMHADPTKPVQLAAGREIRYIDPYAGRVIGSANAEARRFFRVVTDWHRWLGAGTEGRATGKALTGACNLMFLFIVLSGIYLWLPRVWTKASVAAVAMFRGGLEGRARDFNWHNVIGLWCCLPLAFIVAGATVISYPWATNLVYRMTGSAPPPSGAKKGDGPPARDRVAQTEREATDAPPVDLQKLWLKASSSVPDWRTITMRVPANNREPVTFVIDKGYAGQPQLRTTLTLSPAGEIRSVETFDEMNLGRRVRTWLRFVHTGEFYGLGGQTIAGIASAGGVVLVYTGISLSLRRFVAWRARRARRRNEDLDEAAAA